MRAAGGALTPLYDDRLEVPEAADQVWIREHSLAPWVADCVLNRDSEGRWLSRRDPGFDAPLEDVTWEREGIRYLKPEIALSFKAKLHRPKDDRDLAVTVPLLDQTARAFSPTSSLAGSQTTPGGRRSDQPPIGAAHPLNSPQPAGGRPAGKSSPTPAAQHGGSPQPSLHVPPPGPPSPVPPPPAPVGRAENHKLYR